MITIHAEVEVPVAADSKIAEAAHGLATGNTITIWPRISRAAGESYDTEPGAQPWKAKFIGWTTEGLMLISTDETTKYGSTTYSVRTCEVDRLRSM